MASSGRAAALACKPIGSLLPPSSFPPPARLQRCSRRLLSARRDQRRTRGRRLWRAQKDITGEHLHGDRGEDSIWYHVDGSAHSNLVQSKPWTVSADDDNDKRVMEGRLSRILEQERDGGRMKEQHLGVLRADPTEDVRALTDHYTVAAIASALRDREDTLQHCAKLLSDNRLDELSKTLRPYEPKYIVRRRQSEEKVLDLRRGGFDNRSVELLRKGLNRLPRRVSTAHSKRAGVVLPLCNVDGVPCLLFEKRSRALRAHPDEVCLPGGMVSQGDDNSIVHTCLREMEEEIGVDPSSVNVLGVLRCNWGEVHHLVGVAVTPVVCFLGEADQLDPNPDEVAEAFTVPLELFLDRDRWVHKQHYAPIFTAGPHLIWGLTGYIIHRFIIDIVEDYNVLFGDES